ncbi:hypothetical protein MASR1M65_04500 [Saprospiraceae bacterium]
MENAMALDNASEIAAYDAPKKDLYEIGEMPPLGHVPSKMYSWAIRRDRHGPPEQAMQLEVVDTWKLDSHDVLVLVMAAGSTTTASGRASARRSARSTATSRTITSPDPTPRASSGRWATR